MRIGILTGGGDVPGLNPCIKAVVNRAAREGNNVLGIRRGWGGLLNIHPSDPDSVARYTVALDPGVVRKVDRSGGTFLHTSRTNPSKIQTVDLPEFLRGEVADDGPHDVTRHVLSVLDALGVDALIPIGGDDTLSYGLRMHEEGVPVVAVPKTMDNDVSGTDYCIGFSTAITRSVEFIHNLRTSTGSHERIAVVELFGRYSGQTSLIAAYLAGADRALISEVPFDIEKLASLVASDRESNPSRYAIITISEGATMTGGEMSLTGEADAYGHRKLGGIGVQTGDLLKQLTGCEHHQPAGRLSHEVGSARLSGPDGRHELRHDGSRSGCTRIDRAHGCAAERHVHRRVYLRSRRRGEAGRCGGALRRRAVSTEGTTGEQQAHVPLLNDGGPSRYDISGVERLATRQRCAAASTLGLIPHAGSGISG